MCMAKIHTYIYILKIKKKEETGLATLQNSVTNTNK